MAKRITDEDLELLDELGVEIAPEPEAGRSAREQRIIAGYEEIERFVAEHGRLPQHDSSGDIFERLYAVRLDALRAQEECRAILEPLDKRGLLTGTAASGEELSDDQLLESLGVDSEEGSDLTKLTHVRPYKEIKAAEEVAQRATCEDFDKFKPGFETVQQELASGLRQTLRFKENAEVRQGEYFILNGQKVVVAEMGEPFLPDHGRLDRRLRLVYDNGTEADLLMRSFQRALYKDKASRRITEPGAPKDLSLFDEAANEPALKPGETASGTIYVLRSNSDHPFVVQNRALIHKIGVTSGDVKSRIANAKQDPTFLLADVEIVATFHLANINRHKLEKLLHKFLGSARLDMALQDRFETPVKPQEWFFVPFQVIEEIVDRINDGTLSEYYYDLETAGLERV